jgi:hypothetical protein
MVHVTPHVPTWRSPGGLRSLLAMSSAASWPYAAVANVVGQEPIAGDSTALVFLTGSETQAAELVGDLPDAN